MATAAATLVATRGDTLRIIETSDTANPDRDQFENGTLLPSPHATSAGPTFAEWIAATVPATR